VKTVIVTLPERCRLVVYPDGTFTAERWDGAQLGAGRRHRRGAGRDTRGPDSSRAGRRRGGDAAGGKERGGGGVNPQHEAEYRAFLADIIAHPADDAPRLIFADWLEEHGSAAESYRRHLRAEVDRWVRTPSDLPGGTAAVLGRAGEMLAEAQSLDWFGAAERAEFIRAQCELEPLRMHGHGTENPSGGDCETCLTAARLERREWKLLKRWQGRWTTDALDLLPVRHRSPLLQLCARDATRVGKWPSDDAMFRFRRGFFERVTFARDDCTRHLEALRKVQPIERVRVTDWPGVSWNSGPGFVHYYLRDPRLYVAQQGAILSTHDAVPALLDLEFPGVAFDLPQ
jgi:uncharacterized protein (TIGR02996 family)